jgi:hypothetical protein
VRWAGDIVLHEKVNLLANGTLILDQNFTPNTHIRNPVTGVFSGPTYFTCLDSSSLILQSKSNLTCNNLSTLIFESGSYFEINDGAAVTIKKGCTLFVRSGANLVVRGSGRITIETGAHICLESGANINLVNKSSGVRLHKGYVSGINPDVVTQSPACISNVSATSSFTGKGSISLKRRSK